MPEEGMMGGAPQGAPPSPPPPGGPPGQPGMPPQGQATGPGPATMPTANRGLEAAALARLAVYTQGMSQLLAVLPAGSDVARDLREAINKVAKHVPPGAISQGIQMTERQRMLMQGQHQQPQIAAMRAAQMGGGAPQPGMGGGAPPAPPMAA